MTYQPEEFNIVHLEMARQDPAPGNSPSQLGHQLESLASAGRNLETALLREREYSKQLREYINNVINRFNSLQKVEKEQARELQELRTAVKESSRRINELTTDLAKVRSELEKYRTAWTEVLNREQQAQVALSRMDATQKRVSELDSALKLMEQRYQSEKSQRERVESQVNVHRTELQNTLVRLHSSEARFNDMTKELESLHSIRKNHQLEIVKAGEDARIKNEAELVRQYDTMSRELQNERARYHQLSQEREQDKDRIQRELDASYRRELARIKAELEARQAADLKAETADREQAVNLLTESVKSARHDLTRSREELAQAEVRAQSLEIELVKVRAEAAKAAILLEDERTQRSQSHTEFQSSQSRISRLGDELGAAQSRAARLEEEFRIARASESALESELRQSQLQIDSLRREYSVVQDVLREEKQRLSRALEHFLENWDLEDSDQPFVRAVDAFCQDLRQLSRVESVIGVAATPRAEREVLTGPLVERLLPVRPGKLDC